MQTAGWRENLKILVKKVFSLNVTGSPVIVNGDEFENIELRKPSDINNAGHHGGHRMKTQTSNRDLDNNENSKTQEFMELSRNIANLTLGHQVGSSSESERNRELSSGYGSESGDMLRDFVKNKELMQSGTTGTERRRGELPRYSSMDSDVSEGSTLVSTSSDPLEGDVNGSRRSRRSRITHQAIRSTASVSEAVERIA